MIWTKYNDKIHINSDVVAFCDDCKYPERIVKKRRIYG